jgi:hypothetical protein
MADTLEVNRSKNTFDQAKLLNSIRVKNALQALIAILKRRASEQ